MLKYHRKPRVKTQQKIITQLCFWLEKLKRWKYENESKKKDTKNLDDLINFANTKIKRHEGYLKIAIERGDVGKDVF